MDTTQVAEFHKRIADLEKRVLDCPSENRTSQALIEIAKILVGIEVSLDEIADATHRVADNT